MFPERRSPLHNIFFPPLKIRQTTRINHSHFAINTPSKNDTSKFQLKVTAKKNQFEL